ncbi:hypothetical protein C0Q70_08131 [Pomacea canaliculata]|uniref:Rho-GAP domain-containing protein n=1 Tax=Pomacea canaliculata TaxID=400727 RepID=A0A2T7PGY8_POMCA|nr:hypothetical protein C0Q70_08131 [Pomacea canaliculata]
MASHGSKEGLDDYWNEFKEIEENKDGEEEEELPKTPDEGEAEAEWLTNAGYGFVVSKFCDGRDLSDDELEGLTSTLTRPQAEAVRKRIDYLSTTMRKKRAMSKLHEPSSPRSSLDVSGAENQTPNRRTPSFHYRKGEYTLEGAKVEEVRGIEEGVEALSFREQGSVKLPTNRLSRKSLSPLPALSDAEISIEFHLEEKDNQNQQLKPDPHKVDLPAFQPKQDSLGITMIDDISSGDMERIQPLALIELTALFDTYNISYTKLKRKKKSREHGLFGVPLTLLVETDRKRVPGTRVPLVFQTLINHLEKEALDMEGLLRIPGSVTRVKQLREELEEKFYGGTFPWSEVWANDAAALLKQFLRELPEPLLTYNYLEAFSQVEQIPSTLEQLKSLNLLILLLPVEHRDMLRVLLQFLRNIVAHSDQNKMGLNNISMIIAPNLFLAPTLKGKSKAEGPLELHKATNTSNIVKMLIHYQNVLWTIPSSFVAQVRHQYKTEMNRRIRGEKRKLWKKKDRSEAYKKAGTETDVQNGVIRVQAPELTKSSCLIQLDDQITAGDIVAKFRRDYGSGPSTVEPQNRKDSETKGHLGFNNPKKAQFADDHAHLFEVGGNIGERCLDPQTRMMKLYQVNPTAEWVIRLNIKR